MIELHKDVMKQALSALKNSTPIPLPNDDDYAEGAREQHNNTIGALEAAIAQTAGLRPDPTAHPVQPTLDENVLHALARRCLWIAYSWNDHNFYEAYTYAQKTAQENGITNFDEANEWLTAQPTQPSLPIEPIIGKNYENGLWSRRNYEAFLEDQSIVTHPVQTDEIIGCTVAMPGATGFTMAVFNVVDVPIGTYLYACPMSNATELAVDSVRLNWYESHACQIVNLGKVWYWCAAYGQPHRKAYSLRAAIDAAIDAEGKS